jgi:hypothetical protein
MYADLRYTATIEGMEPLWGFGIYKEELVWFHSPRKLIKYLKKVTTDTFYGAGYKVISP